MQKNIHKICVIAIFICLLYFTCLGGKKSIDICMFINLCKNILKYNKLKEKKITF